MELEMQEERDLSLHFFPPFVFLHRKISTDPQAPTHPTCLVLGMPRATWWGLVATSSPIGMAQDESSASLPAGSVLPGIWYWPTSQGCSPDICCVPAGAREAEQKLWAHPQPSITAGALTQGHMLWSSRLWMPGSLPHCHKGLKTPSTADTTYHPSEKLEGGSMGAASILTGSLPAFVPLLPNRAKKGGERRSVLSLKTQLWQAALCSSLHSQLTATPSAPVSVCSIREQPCAAKCPLEFLQVPSPRTAFRGQGRDFSLPEQSSSAHCFQVRVKVGEGSWRSRPGLRAEQAGDCSSRPWEGRSPTHGWEGHTLCVKPALLAAIPFLWWARIRRNPV